MVGSSAKTLLSVATLAEALAANGCFFYDSRWGQASASQHRVAAQATPHLTRSDPNRGERSEASEHGVRTMTLRVLATPHYASALVDWRRQFDDTLNDANPTLRRDFGIELRVADYRVWTQMESDDSLEQLLRALRAADPGEGADWVVGLASAVPALADSPDRIGVGETPGKHLVVRAMNDAAEFDAIEREFTELTDTERRKLYSVRKRHKSAFVLLHELGHTLGMQHETGGYTAMNPRYDSRVESFSPAAIAIGRQTLSQRLDARSSNKSSAAASQVANASPSSSAPTLSEAGSAESSPLSDSDRSLFDRALVLEKAGKSVEARQLAAPLFSAYPKVHAVQDLRCRLAMAIRGGYDDQVRAECDALLTLPKGRAK